MTYTEWSSDGVTWCNFYIDDCMELQGVAESQGVTQHHMGNIWGMFGNVGSSPYRSSCTF